MTKTHMRKWVNKIWNANAQSDMTDCTNYIKINKHNNYTMPVDIEVLFLKISFVMKNK